MLNQVNIENQLKIGFLNSLKKEEEQLDLYLETFDVVIKQDGNLWPVV